MGNRGVTQAGDPAKAAAKLRLLGSTYTVPDAIAEIQALASALPDFDAETLPATLLTVMEGSPQPLPAAESMLERLLADGRQPPVLVPFFRMRLEARRGRWAAVLEQAEACLEALETLRAPAGETPEARPARLRALYGRYYPPIHLGKGFNTDINRAYREDLGVAAAQTAALREAAGAAGGGSGWDGYVRLLRAHCLEAQARALTALDRPAEAREKAAAIPADAFVSVDAHARRAEAAERGGDAAGSRREWEAAFRDRPLDTAVWDKLAEALMGAGDRPALLEFLGDILILARRFLPADQAAAVQRRLDAERGP